MIRVFLNGLAASAGAGLTYLRNVVPHLSALPDVRTTLAVQPTLRQSFEAFTNVDFLCPEGASGAVPRFWFEQRQLPVILEKSPADVLISAGNFALRNSPVPQILLSGNSLYTSADFYRDLRRRREFVMLTDTFLRGRFAQKSVRWADATVAPTQAYANELNRWTGRRIALIHHGFDPRVFFGDGTAMPPELEQKLFESRGYLRLLFVSHYNYYRNFETLLRALPLLQKLLPGKKVKLFLTCKLQPGANPGAYNPATAAKLIQDLGISGNVVQLGAIPYQSLHHLYRACDVYVTAAYAETFAHPLVEAMASGLPVIASDIPPHREVCADAARYFPCFSAESLANTVAELASSNASTELSKRGKERCKVFSWQKHVRELLHLALQISQTSSRRAENDRVLAIGA